MMISLASSRAHGFKRWSDAHEQTTDSTEESEESTVVPRNRDAAVVAHAIPERPRGPWPIPGVGSSI